MRETLDDTLGDGPRAGEARPIARGESIGRFVVLQRLGSGGMGVVYSAYDPELDRRVALKLLHRDLGRGTLASAGRIKLVREAKALARVSHANVVGVHDVGEHEGNVFLALEFVEGETFGEWLARGRRSIPEILEVLVAAGRGVAAAHAAGIIHRDFKPDNVLVGSDGRVRVTDFGLAMDVDEGQFPSGLDPWTSSPSGVRMRTEARRGAAGVGTPAYMAPEQFLGLELDARCDQFSFCVTLWGSRPRDSKPATSRVFSAQTLGITGFLRRFECSGVPRRVLTYAGLGETGWRRVAWPGRVRRTRPSCFDQFPRPKPSPPRQLVPDDLLVLPGDHHCQIGHAVG